jgi:hypothetical protein
MLSHRRSSSLSVASYQVMSFPNVQHTASPYITGKSLRRSDGSRLPGEAHSTRRPLASVVDLGPTSRPGRSVQGPGSGLAVEAQAGEAASEERSPSLTSFGPGAGARDADDIPPTRLARTTSAELASNPAPRSSRSVGNVPRSLHRKRQELQVRGASEVKKRPDPGHTWACALSASNGRVARR